MESNLGISGLLLKAKLVLYTVLEFLDSDDLSNLLQQIQCEHKINPNTLLAILKAYIYIRLHINGTDRSYYYFVYDSPSFRHFQKRAVAANAESSNTFNHLYDVKNRIEALLTHNLLKVGNSQIAADIWSIFNDPSIPSLRLLRETVGIGCKSLFQNFLVSLREESYTMADDQYPTLSEFYQKRTDQAYIRQFLKIDRSKYKTTDFAKIRKIRFFAYHINCEELQSCFLPENQLHNFIVILFGIGDLMVQGSAAYLNGIEDPNYRFMQFCLRYAIYRNFVLNIQEKFSFVFQAYSHLYLDVFLQQNVKVPNFSFWRPSFSKWLFHMSKFHQEFTQITNLHIFRKRKENLQQKLSTLKEDLFDYTKIRNSLELLDLQKNSQLKKIQNKEIYEVIEQQIPYCINQYKQYMVDLSLDQITVNWCGYSNQKLGFPYNSFQNRILHLNNMFCNEILSLSQDLSNNIKLIQIDLKFIQKYHYYNESVISKYVQQIQARVGNLSDKIQLKYKIQNSDQKIWICNQKAKIPLIIQNQQSRELHQLNPQLETQIGHYIQMKSIQTMDDSNFQVSDDSCGNQDLEYYSDNQMFQQNDDYQKDFQIGDFMIDQPLCEQQVIEENLLIKGGTSKIK